MQPQATQTPPKPSETETQPQAAAPAPTTPGAPAMPSAPAKSGYGKRPVWQWVVIYLVIAIVVYGIIYFAFIHKSGTTSGY